MGKALRSTRRTDKVVVDNSKTINITRVEVSMPPGQVGELIEGECRELTDGE